MSKIDTLLKKSKGKLKGDEVGRLMIADLIECYKHALTGGDVNTGLFSEKEKTELVNALEGKEEIARYNKYRYLNDFLTRFPTLNALQEQIFDNYYFRLYSLLKTAQSAEHEYWFDHFTPLIVTEEQYRELTAKQQAEERERTYTAFDIFLDFLNDVLMKYESGNRLKIRKDIDKTKSLPITNERIKKYYYDKGQNGHYETEDGETESQVNPVVWREFFDAGLLKFVDEREAPEDAKAFETLEDASAWYNPDENRGDYAETPNNNMLEEFKADFPSIYSYIWGMMIKEPALEPIKKMTAEELTTAPFITGLELANAGILDYKHRINEEYRGSDVNYCGVAVLKAGIYNTETATLDRMPHYHFLSEHLLTGDTKDVIEEYLDTIANSLIQLYSYNTVLNLISEKLAIEGLEVFYSNMQDRQDRIAILNDLFEDFYSISRDGRTPDEKPTEELRAEIKELLPCIDIRKYRPTEELYNRLKDDFTLESLEGKGLAYTDEVANAIREAIEGV